MIFGMAAIMSFNMLVAGNPKYWICNVSSATIKTRNEDEREDYFFNTLATS
jgi:hypothetical protein